MKKLISALFVFIMLASLFPFQVFADTSNIIIVKIDHYDKSDDCDIVYYKDTKTLTISCYGDFGILGYDDTYNYETGNPMGWNPEEVMQLTETLVFNDNITAIGDYMFMNFWNLKKVVFPDTLERLGKASFANCEELSVIQGGKNITDIDGGAFLNCANLKTVSFPKLENLNNNLVSTFKTIDGFDEGCSLWGLDDTYSIGAFMHCRNLEKINIPKIKTLGDRTFFDCPKLKTINTNNKLSNISSLGVSAFYNCRSLKNISLPKVKSLKSARLLNDKPILKKQACEGVFSNCISLESVNIPNVKVIGANTFYNCKKLKKINNNNSLKKVTYLGAGAFIKCASLEKISLPKVKKLKMSKWTDNDFQDYPSSGPSYYYDFYGVNYLGDRTYGTFEGCTKLKSVSVPNVTTVGARAFYQCQSLKSISMPKAKTLGASAFYNCKSLKTAYLPKVKNIKSAKWTDFKTKKNYYRGVFEKCKKLKSLTTSGLNSVGIYDFKECTSLPKIVLGKGLTTIGEKAFYNAKKLKSITIKSSKLKSVGKSAFGKIKSNATFTVPKKQLKKYKKLIKPTAPKKVKYKSI